MAKRLDSFDVNARMIIVAGITIKAESYEDAVARSKELSVDDFVRVKDQHCDSSLVIGSISKSDYWNTDQD